MRTVWMFGAGLMGWMVDSILTSILSPGMQLLLNLDAQYFNLSDPKFWLAHIIIPMLCTVIGGGVAGRIAPHDAAPGGALVGGVGILLLLLYVVEGPVTEPAHQIQVYAMAQVAATALAMVSAMLVARRYVQREES